ncbi:hypothetical protein [Virgibacillus senegalensis]|uniref:hypothetical protein n=1 Tax=Virgibacillus senegalensis TaxID=1499679 RepID=UPI00069E7FC7|nr:hypothetical protein [Virgibacillus senegalensis]
MDKHKPITVRINDNKRKPVNAKQHDHPEASDKTVNEQAAALEKNLQGSSSPLFNSPIEDGTSEWYQRKTSVNKKVPRIFKVFIFAAISALMIGLTLGFIMLRMFAGIDESGDPQAVPSSYTSSQNDNPSAGAEQDSSAETGQNGMTAFVVQGGVFSSNDKAEAWQKNFTDAGFPSMIWERDGQFYLFAGVADTEAAAKKIASAMTEKELETYVKPWQAETVGKNLAEGQAEWLQQFTILWQKSVSTGEIKATEWNDWLKLLPEDASEPLVQLHDQAEKMAADASDLSPKEGRIALLSLWKKATEQ